MSSTLFPVANAVPAGAVISAIMAIQMRNLDALAAAQKAIMEGMGILAKQQQEMLAASLKEATSTPASLMDPDPRVAMAKPFDAIKSAMLDGTAKANLLSQLAAQSNAAVAEILQNRAIAALDEMKAAMLQAIPPAFKG